jgi:predicted ABC-type sugar transport system permease subunit
VTLLAPPLRSSLRASGRRCAAAAIGALALASLHIPGRPATVCPLRALTGIPCPLCGGTTAAVNVGRFDLLGALRANPFVVVGALLVVVLPVLAALRRPIALSRRTTIVLAIVAIACSEIWQLVRFGII